MYRHATIDLFSQQHSRRRLFSLVLSGLLAIYTVPARQSLAEVPSGATGCDTNSHVYYLNQTRINVRIVHHSNTAGDRYIFSRAIILRTPDIEFPFCLDYLRAPTANYALSIKKSSDGLLIGLSNKVDDDFVSAEKNTAESFFVGLSPSTTIETLRSNSSTQSTIVAVSVFEAQYDPFNELETALVNDILNDFGFCILTDNQRARANLNNIDEYCDAPLQSARKARKQLLAMRANRNRPAVLVKRSGIFYRPRLPQKFRLYAKKDLRASGRWRLRSSQIVFIENDAPIMCLGVDRSIFATHDTKLEFDNGALTSVKVSTPSELWQSITIPLSIAQSGISLPPRNVSIHFNRTHHSDDLRRVETALIKAHDSAARLWSKNFKPDRGAVRDSSK